MAFTTWFTSVKEVTVEFLLYVSQIGGWIIEFSARDLFKKLEPWVEESKKMNIGI